MLGAAARCLRTHSKSSDRRRSISGTESSIGSTSTRKAAKPAVQLRSTHRSRVVAASGRVCSVSSPPVASRSSTCRVARQAVVHVNVDGGDAFGKCAEDEALAVLAALALVYHVNWIEVLAGAGRVGGALWHG